jgi:hypothetical protein
MIIEAKTSVKKRVTTLLKKYSSIYKNQEGCKMHPYKVCLIVPVNCS